MELSLCSRNKMTTETIMAGTRHPPVRWNHSPVAKPTGQHGTSRNMKRSHNFFKICWKVPKCVKNLLVLCKFRDYEVHLLMKF